MLVENTELISSNISRDADGELLFAGRRVSELAEKYFTPLYLYDEERIREKCRIYKAAMKKSFGEGAKVLYASKAASFMRMYKIMDEEDMGIDVVSSGELHPPNNLGILSDSNTTATLPPLFNTSLQSPQLCPLYDIVR